jgi:hypothetical protein
MEASATGVREHVQAVIFGLGLIGARLESLMFFPVGLPLGFDLLRLVLCHFLHPSIFARYNLVKSLTAINKYISFHYAAT